MEITEIYHLLSNSEAQIRQPHFLKNKVDSGCNTNFKCICILPKSRKKYNQEKNIKIAIFLALAYTPQNQPYSTESNIQNRHIFARFCMPRENTTHAIIWGVTFSVL